MLGLAQLRGQQMRSAGVHTSGGVQSLATSVALEVFCLLMGDEKFQVLKVSLACDRVSWDRRG